MPVITMTREMGSLGVRVAQEVSKRLQLRLVYQQLVEGVAQRCGLGQSAVGRFLEGESGFVDNLFVDPRRLGISSAQEVLELAAAGNVLIRGWGANYVLASVPHVIRLRVCAPIERRIQNMCKRMDSLDTAGWRREIEASDQNHWAVIEQMHGTNSWQDPSHYHLVLDTSVTSVEACTERVIAMTEEPRFQESAASRAALADALLAAQIKAVLRGERICIGVRDGQVRLNGTVAAAGHRKLLDTVGAHPGVTAVEDQLQVMREASRYMSD